MNLVWETTIASAVQVGDRIRSRGLELTVMRIDTPFLGRENFVAFVEDSDEQWLKVPTPLDATVERVRPPIKSSVRSVG